MKVRNRLATLGHQVSWLRPGLILLLAIILYMSFLIWQDIQQYKELKIQSLEFKRNIKKEQDLGRELEKKRELLNRNDYIEGLAREKLGLVRRGEIAYKIIKQ